MVKNLPANAGDIKDAIRESRSDAWIGKIPSEENMAAHSSILAWRLPWPEELCRL